jgi:hypothetical protein
LHVDDANKLRSIKDRILENYPAVSQAYENDAKVKEAIDAYTKPDGDLTNKGKLK